MSLDWQRTPSATGLELPRIALWLINFLLRKRACELKCGLHFILNLGTAHQEIKPPKSFEKASDVGLAEIWLSLEKLRRAAFPSPDRHEGFDQVCEHLEM